MISSEERQYAVDQLTESHVHLAMLFDGLVPAQWHFRERPERWSIAENLEHLILFEGFIPEMIAKALEAPAHPERKAEAASKEPFVRAIAESRADQKLRTRDLVRPGQRTDTAAMIAEFEAARNKTIAFAAETQAELRDHFFPHISLGALDCYQWLLLMGQHTLRHCLQIEEIKADPAYPPQASV